MDHLALQIGNHGTTENSSSPTLLGHSKITLVTPAAIKASILCHGIALPGGWVKTLVPLVNIKIAGKWMFIPLKMVLIGFDPYPHFPTGLWGNHTAILITRPLDDVPTCHFRSRKLLDVHGLSSLEKAWLLSPLPG